MARNKAFYKMIADLAVIVTGFKPFGYFFNLRALLAGLKKKKLNKSGLIFCNCSGRRFNPTDFPGSIFSPFSVL
jgi:hypothetical protein